MFPSQRFTIRTLLSPEEVQKKLREVVEPPQLIRLGSDPCEKPYQGEIRKNSFHISRIIHYRNSFLPKISGRMEAQSRGSEIHIEMKLDPLVAGFMVIWLGAVALACIGVLVALLSGEPFQLALLVPFGMLSVGCALPFVGFVSEAKRSKQFLIELLQR